MLEIQEKFSTEGYEAVAEAAKGKKLHITEALDNGGAIGFIAYSYDEDVTVVYDYDDGGDLLLCDGLVRSVMFKSCLKGIEKMLFKLPDADKYVSLYRLKFIPEGGNTAENLDGFMNGCENCKHANPQ